MLLRSWPLGLLALPFGTVYCLLLCFLSDSIEVYDELPGNSEWGGVEVLFVLNSGVLAWVSVVVSERRTETEGFLALLFAFPWCFAAIGGGFAVALLFLGSLSDAMMEMLVFSVVSSIVIGGLRASRIKLLGA